jgi:hypothetical protein
MEEIKQQLEKFFVENNPTIIVNTTTDQALLCLDPEFETLEEGILLKFESLNERGGNSITVKAIQGSEEATLYIENDEENVLMLQALSLTNYNHYIKAQYFNAPEVTSLEEVVKYINEQK